MGVKAYSISELRTNVATGNAEDRAKLESVNRLDQYGIFSHDKDGDTYSFRDEQYLQTIIDAGENNEHEFHPDIAQLAKRYGVKDAGVLSVQLGQARAELQALLTKFPQPMSNQSSPAFAVDVDKLGMFNTDKHATRVEFYNNVRNNDALKIKRTNYSYSGFALTQDSERYFYVEFYGEQQDGKIYLASPSDESSKPSYSPLGEDNFSRSVMQDVIPLLKEAIDAVDDDSQRTTLENLLKRLEISRPEPSPEKK